MESKNGTDYAQNYDVTVKWMAEALIGQTLEVIGVKTGRIKEVFGFEPTEISVQTGRVDLILKDEAGALFHIEEQRNLKKSDMYRSAAYHFMAAKQWGDRITDIILASGNIYSGKKSIATDSGKYTPVVIDFGQRDGRKRLEEIRREVEAGVFDNWLELVFLPLYGKETGTARSKMVEKLIRFETELLRMEKISERLLAATLVMANKIIDKDRIRELWEEIKMLDVLEVAKEIGIEKGKTLGILETTRKMLIDALFEKYGVLPPRIPEQIGMIDNPISLESLFRQVFRCEDMAAFEEMLQRVAVEKR